MHEHEEDTQGNGEEERHGGFVAIDWDGDKADLADVVPQNSHRYGSYVNLDRAIPDVRDGLKPVHRRIVYGFHDLGVRNDRPFSKSAKVVGHVMGEYHPHGDQAIYDALVRLAQDWVSSTPLVEGQGNFGTVDGDNAAAARYTESRLSAIASLCTPDIRKEVVDFRSNYAETTTEPRVLPMAFPAALCLGTEGVGWALACSIPPHNLGEVIDATVYLAEHPEASTAQLMKRLPGPDFPTGGVIVNPDALASIYETGNGTIRVQGRYHVENIPGNQQQVVITEFPYMTGPSKIVEQLTKARKDGKTDQLTEPPKDVSDTSGKRVIVKCKRGGNVNRLIADLLKLTSLEITVKFNFNLLVNRRPQVLGLKAILQHFLDFRYEVVTRRLEHERATLHQQLRRLLAILSALASIDEVIKIIRSAEDDEDATAKLIAKLKVVPHGAKKAVPIDEEQAGWILETQIRRLARLARFTLEKEAKEKGDRIDEITAILEAEFGVRDVVIAELKAVKKGFAVPRVTAFADGTTALAPPEDAPGNGGAVAVASGPAVPAIVTLASDGMGTLMERTFKIAGGSLPLTPADSARIIACYDAESTTPILAVSAQGQMYRVQPGPLDGKRGKGRSLIPLERGDSLACAFPEETEGPTHALFATRRGDIKRVEYSMLTGAHAGGSMAIRVEDGDRVVACVPHRDGDTIMLVSEQGQLLRIDPSALRAVKGGNAAGVAGMKLAKGDVIISASVVDGPVVIVAHETGLGKFVAADQYPVKGRNGGGVASSDPSKPTKGPAAGVTLTQAIPGDGEVWVWTARGQVVALGDRSNLVSRSTVAKHLFELGPGDMPMGVLRRA